MTLFTPTRRLLVSHIAQARFHLDADGCCVLRGLVDPAIIAAIDADLSGDFAATPTCVGDFYGPRTKRLGRVLTRSTRVAELVLQPLILPLAHDLLRPWCDLIQLNVAQAIEIESGAVSQYPHRDQDMWWGEKGRIEYLVNIIWPLTAFRQDNGATLLWPRSHGPAADLAHDGRAPMVAECKPGDAIVILGSTLHGAGANITGDPRRGIVIGYSLGWLKPYENPWLAYPPETARHFLPALATLVGYRQHRPNLGNFEGQCPSILLRGPVDRPLNAVDALLPKQSAELARYTAEHRDGRVAGAVTELR